MLPLSPVPSQASTGTPTQNSIDSDEDWGVEQICSVQVCLADRVAVGVALGGACPTCVSLTTDWTAQCCIALQRN